MTQKDFRFDFAISFAGTDRATAKQLCIMLRDIGFRVFYDRDYEHEMLGRNGLEYLHQVYSSESRYCLVLISADYDQREWTQLEREAIQAREVRGERGILIPLFINGYRPSWLPATRIYFDLAERTLTELVTILGRFEGLKKTESRSHTTDRHPPRVETPGIDRFNYRFSNVSQIDDINESVLAQLYEIGHRELYEFNIDNTIQMLFQTNPTCIHCWTTIKEPAVVIAFFILALINEITCKQILQTEICGAKQLSKKTFVKKPGNARGIYIMNIVSTNRRYHGYLMKHVQEEIDKLLKQNPKIRYIFTRPINEHVATLATKHGFKVIGTHPSPIYFTTRSKIKLKGKLLYPYESSIGEETA